MGDSPNREQSATSFELQSIRKGIAHTLDPSSHPTHQDGKVCTAKWLNE